MNEKQLIELLNTLVRYELEETGRAYSSDKSLVENRWGEWVKAEDLAKAFNLKFDYDKGFSK